MNSLEFVNFYDLAEYVNEINRGKFTPREIANYAHIYWQDYVYSLRHGRTAHSTMWLQERLAEMDEDNSLKWIGVVLQNDLEKSRENLL